MSPKNLTDHFLEEWFWRPAAIASYSGGRLAGARAATAWRGMKGEPIGEDGKHLADAFDSFADDLSWWFEAAKEQRMKKAPPC